MKRKGILGLVLAIACAACLVVGCSATGGNDAKSSQGTSNEHPTITMNAPYRNMSVFYDLVHEKYPEINLEIIPYNGEDYTAYVNDICKKRPPVSMRRKSPRQRLAPTWAIAACASLNAVSAA